MFDGTSSNVSCVKALGCVINERDQIFESSFRLDNNQDISAFFDPCHMVKSARNALAACKVIETSEGAVRWQYSMNPDEL